MDRLLLERKTVARGGLEEPEEIREGLFPLFLQLLTGSALPLPSSLGCIISPRRGGENECFVWGSRYRSGSQPPAPQRFWYGWKMYSLAFTAVWQACPQSERLLA